MARLAQLFDESDNNDSEEDLVADKLDSLAANENLDKFLKKVDRHLDVEKALITDWKD